MCCAHRPRLELAAAAGGRDLLNHSGYRSSGDAVRPVRQPRVSARTASSGERRPPRSSTAHPLLHARHCFSTLRCGKRTRCPIVSDQNYFVRPKGSAIQTMSDIGLS